MAGTVQSMHHCMMVNQITSRTKSLVSRTSMPDWSKLHWFGHTMLTQWWAFIQVNFDSMQEIEPK